MILNNRNEERNLRFIVKVDDYDYVIFETSAGIKSFGCGEEGHMQACPRKGDLNPVNARTGARPPAPAPSALGRRGSAAWRSAPPASGPAAVSEWPALQGAAPRSAAAVQDDVHRVSSVNTQGVCECERE